MQVKKINKNLAIIMSTLHPSLANLNNQSADSQIIEVIWSILASCNDIKDVARFQAMEDGKSRNFIIDTYNTSNVNKVIEILGERSGNCKAFATSSVLLKIAD